MQKKWAKRYYFIRYDLLVRYAGPLKKIIRQTINFTEYFKRKNIIKNKLKVNLSYLKNFEINGFTSIKIQDSLLKELMCESKKIVPLQENLETPNVQGKVFFKQLLKQEDIVKNDIFLRLAINEEILDLISAKMKCAAYLESVELIFSLPVKNISQSQNWHIDRTDKAVIKLFIYCSDVAEENGPFTLISKADSCRIGNLMSPHYITDVDLAQYVEKEKWIKVTGDSGTSFLVDTMDCYHQGSRCSKPRLAYVAYYNSGLGYFPRQGNWEYVEKYVENLSPMQRMALGLI
jgi:hypothetical protein